MVFVSDAPPRESLNWGATNTTAPSNMYMETCDDTIMLEGFRLAAYFDVGRGSRHVNGVVEQIVAAFAVEPYLLEPIQEVGQPIIQPALPLRRLPLSRRSAGDSQ